MDKSINQLNPNDVIKIGDKWFRCRYFYYSDRETSIDLQRESDELSYYCDSTCIRISINKDIDIKFEVQSETDT